MLSRLWRIQRIMRIVQGDERETIKINPKLNNAMDDPVIVDIVCSWKYQLWVELCNMIPENCQKNTLNKSVED